MDQNKLSLIISNKKADEKWNCQISKAQKSKVTAESQDQIMKQCMQSVKQFETDMLSCLTKKETMTTELAEQTLSPIETKNEDKTMEAVDTGKSQYNSTQGFGFFYLEKLIQLMEQLSQLREVNSNLRNRCEYLQDTKELLTMRNQMLSAQIHKTPKYVKTNSRNKLGGSCK